MDPKGVVIVMLPCFLFMVATLTVSAAAVNLSNDRTDSASSDEFTFNGRAVLDEKSDKFRSSMDRHEKRDVYGCSLV